MEKINKINRRAFESNTGGLYIAEYRDNTLVRYGYSYNRPTASIVEDLRGDLTHWTINYSDPGSLAEFASLRKLNQIGLLDEDGDVFVWPAKAGVAGLEWMGIDYQSGDSEDFPHCLDSEELVAYITHQDTD